MKSYLNQIKTHNTYSDSCVTTHDPGMFLQTLQHLLAHVQVVLVSRGPVQEVSGFNELGTEQVLTPMHLKTRMESSSTHRNHFLLAIK